MKLQTEDCERLTLAPVIYPQLKEHKKNQFLGTKDLFRYMFKCSQLSCSSLYHTCVFVCPHPHPTVAIFFEKMLFLSTQSLTKGYILWPHYLRRVDWWRALYPGWLFPGAGIGKSGSLRVINVMFIWPCTTMCLENGANLPWAGKAASVRICQKSAASFLVFYEIFQLPSNNPLL
jgi:hypothetical protein